ncbi:MAG: hypothetical protein QG591_93 [Planctomycetota bacterium]|nr:hypothetical protein [Planctomycetota bacterium]
MIRYTDSLSNDGSDGVFTFSGVLVNQFETLKEKEK